MRNVRRLLAKTFIIVFLFLTSLQAFAGVETMPTGSYIINMGVMPQTVGNGLKPYGLVYDLIKNYSVPVKWVINPTKPKDGDDFFYNGVSYKGGTFIIPASSITSAVQTRINFWITQGVVTSVTTSSLSVDVTHTLKIAPRWVLDAGNGNIAVPFFTAAGIPSSAYIFKSPNQLGNCDDIYVMPHATPSWSTHNNLYYWNLTYKGAIWAGCHAVSNMENSYGPDVNNSTITRRMNFLMLDGPSVDKNALSFLDHTAGTPPYTSGNTGHPVMQFMGKTDNAHASGFETVYLPEKAGGWRAGTFMGTYDASHNDIPSKSWGPAAALVFGRGFNDANRGWVLYEGGHSIAGTTPDHVAAQRAFFNFSYLSSLDKLPVITLGGDLPNLVLGSSVSNLTVSAVSLTGSTGFTYLWSTTCGGTFSNPTGSSTTFTAPAVGSNTTCVITCRVTDNCGRISFENRVVTIYPSQRSPVCAADNATLSTACGGGSITVNVLANDTDADGDALTATLTGNGANGNFVNDGNGNITYTPNPNFFGTDQVSYTVSDGTGRSCTSTLSIAVTGVAGTNGCSSTQFYGQVDGVSAVGNTASGSATNPLNSEGGPDGSPGDGTTYTTMPGNGDMLIMPLEVALTATGSNISIYVDATSSGTFRVEQNVSGNTWTNPIVYTVNASDDFTEASAKIYTTNLAGVTRIRVTNLTTGNTLYVDAIEFKIFGCVSAIPTTEPDEATTLEDNPVIIDVLANDSDPQAFPIVISGITVQPLHGKVSINPNGTITYQNNKDQVGTGTDVFSYRVCNSTGFCSSTSVTVKIIADLCGPGLYKTFTFAAPTEVLLNPTADNYLLAKFTTQQKGADATLYVKGKSNDVRRSLLQFDLSTILAGAIVDSATLRLYKVSGAADNISLFRLSTAWTGGNSTWVRATSTTNWTTPGGDRAANLYANINVGSIAGYKTWNIKPLVQGWLSATYPNYGVTLLRSPEGAGNSNVIFYSNENATNKPLLYVRYRLPGACLPIPAFPPLAMSDTAVTPSTVPVTINVSGNDFDYNATGLTVSLLTATSSRGGTLAMSGNNILYTPPLPAAVAIDTFRYRVCSSGLCDTAVAYVRVINSAPFANTDSYVMLSNTATTPNSITAAVLVNDTDPEGASLSAPTITVQPKNGVATVSGNNIVYTPGANYIGTDTLIYLITDISGSCSLLPDTALVVFTINNRAPVAIGESYAINPCEAKDISVTTNDIDPEAGTLSIQIVSGPAVGTATLVNNNTQIQYQAPSGVTNTTTTLTYQVCDNAIPSLCSNTVTLTINIRAVAVNAPPVAARDTFYMSMNETLYSDVLSNDTDPDADNFKMPVAVIINPVNGSVISYNNGLIGYTPSYNFTGIDSFRYEVCDTTPKLTGCPGSSSLCSSAWVYVSVQNVPVANWGKMRASINTSTIFPVLTNDFFGTSGPGAGSITIASAPSRGAIAVLTNASPNQSSNTLRYTPNLGYSGIDSLIYQICDSKGDCDTALVYIWVVKDTDGDGVADDLDFDDDNDGIPDVIEICGAGATSFSCTTNGTDPSSDDDNDGIVNYRDGDWCVLNIAGTCASLDADEDGVPDFLDRDSDNDGIADVIEAGGVDANGDGIIDNFCDTDADGLSQNVDANNTGAAGSGQGLGAPDFDNDGVPNALDLDSDNDGIPDIVESFGADINNDGMVDVFADTDGDGLSNQFDGDADGNGTVENLAGVLVLTLGDPSYVNCATPGNGRPGCYTLRGNNDGNGLPNFIDLDSDGDGITDATESGISAATYVRGMVSGCTLVKGWCNTITSLPALNLLNSDNNGRPDAYDIDSDNDGITDNIEAQPTASFIVATEADADGDGLANVYDFYNGIGGNGLTPYDHDADGMPDYRDLDSDNDVAPDRNEGDKQNSLLTQATIDGSGDSDGDGLMNYFDAFDLVTPCANVGMNVCMSNMGSAGNFNGPLPGGSMVQLVQSSTGATNRDWRNNTTLPLQVLTFTGSMAGSQALLEWKVQNEAEVSYYVIERSIDAVQFNKIANVNALYRADKAYNYRDDVNGLNAAFIYYRIIQVNKDGNTFSTNVIKLKPSTIYFVGLNIYPNPVLDVATVSVLSEIKESASLIISDIYGKIISNKKINIEKGVNNYYLPDFKNLPTGMYMIKLVMQQQTFNEKIIKK